MRQLLLLRHAKSDWSHATADFDRPLNRRGTGDASRIGLWMHQQQLTPDLVIASPAQRAKETTLLVTQELGIHETALQWEPRVYEASVETLLDLVRSIPNTASRTLLVGHNPGIESLLHYLVGGDIPTTPRGKGITTASLAQLEIPDTVEKIQHHCAQLQQLIRPADI